MCASYVFAFYWIKKSHKIISKHLKLEDLKRSPDLLNNVKIGHSQLRLNIQTYFLPYMGMVAIIVK